MTETAPSATPFKAGFVVLLGRPNAGKSTLMNALLGSKLSIVSAQPQTTRHKILGILDQPAFQICFLDTPGFLPDPKDPLQAALRHAASAAAKEDPDVLVLLVEPKKPDADTVRELAALARASRAVILAVNKIDITSLESSHDAVVAAYTEAVRPAAVVRISALKKLGLEALMKEILSRLPESPPFYEQGQLSDRWERFFAAELIREQVFALYTEEIPHATAVVIEQFQEKAGHNKADLIRATLYVERDGQKGIILGKQGRALRELHARAHQALEAFLGRRVELDVWVKVRHNWRKDARALQEFGYTPEK